jgi:hypothetical protein
MTLPFPKGSNRKRRLLTLWIAARRALGVRRKRSNDGGATSLIQNQQTPTKTLSVSRHVQMGFTAETQERKSWHVSGGCVIGPKHAKTGGHCEDAAAWFCTGDTLFIALADGAGSASHARVGSALAVRVAVEAMMHTHLTGRPITLQAAGQILVSLFESAQNRVCEQAALLGVKPTELSSTLITVLANPQFVLAAQVGDGAVVLGDSDSNVVALTKPTKGEFANETRFLLGASRIDTSICTSAEFRFRYLAAFTDGVERMALQLPSGTPHPGFFVPIFSEMGNLPESKIDKAITKFLNSPTALARSDDDKSLLVAHLS